ncbi:hypothetical protein [Vallitalea guaymasensis]|uniref:hypothetical protein n=1 Tax=Vallitalea guaymasensis TaxID=1185412 RepID=UPI000DE2725C|nr:hypothetical protein [Vallitalea guaymasensis]
MNIDFSLIIQLILVALIMYFMYIHIDTTNNGMRFFKQIFIYNTISSTQYLDYKTTLYQEDIESYHKYKIWIFFEKTKLIFN